MQIDIRKATKADAAIAWQIRRDAILVGCVDEYPCEDLDTWTVGPHSHRFAEVVTERFYLATHQATSANETILGTGAIDLSSGHIDGFFVAPKYMKCGVGRRILSFLECLGVEAGLTCLRLESTLNAVEFYRRCGFRGETSCMVQSSRGIALPCVEMEKTLRPFSRGV